MSRGKRGKARQDSVMAGIAAGITTRRTEADRLRESHRASPLETFTVGEWTP